MLRYLLGRIVCWFLIQQRSDEVIDGIKCHSHSCHQVGAFRLWRQFSVLNGGVDCVDMISLEALVQFGSSGIQSVRSGDVSVRGVHGCKDWLKVFELEAFEVFCGFFFLFWSGISCVRNRNEEAI